MDSLLGQRVILFAILLVFLTCFSRRSLTNTRCHGFYRYFSFVGIAALLVISLPVQHYWPQSVGEVVSIVLLFLSLLSVMSSYLLLLRLGGHRVAEAAPENFHFENTANLVQSGIYRYIRHPMYTSLLLLAFALFIRDVSLQSTFMVAFSSTFIVLAANMEERENLKYFKERYRRYINSTKRFIPFVF